MRKLDVAVWVGIALTTIGLAINVWNAVNGYWPAIVVSPIIAVILAATIWLNISTFRIRRETKRIVRDMELQSSYWRSKVR